MFQSSIPVARQRALEIRGRVEPRALEVSRARERCSLSSGEDEFEFEFEFGGVV